jgi:hypothetical protein
MGAYDAEIGEAVRAFWDTRESQMQRQRDSGRLDAGTRGAVTGGAHLDPITDLIIKAARTVGVTAHTGNAVEATLPGYFRPSKKWDIVFRRADVPLAAIELKSMVGSFGNNMNNRTEEALGNAVDVQAAADNGLLPVRPWLGYVYLMQRTDGSDRVSSLGAKSGIAIDPMFHAASYLDRLTMLCERLVSSRVYNGSWAIASEAPPEFSWWEPEPKTTGFEIFIRSLVDHLRS